MGNTDKSAEETEGDFGHLQPVLCAVDFSGDSKAAVKWAHRNVPCLGTYLLILHVVHDPLDSPGYYKQTENEHLQPMDDVAETMMKEFVSDQLGINPDDYEANNVATKLVVGIPVTRILEVAKNVRAQSIVMGSQGRTGLKHLLLGSKAEQIVRLAKVPVTIVKEPKEKK